MKKVLYTFFLTLAIIYGATGGTLYMGDTGEEVSDLPHKH